MISYYTKNRSQPTINYHSGITCICTYARAMTITHTTDPGTYRTQFIRVHFHPILSIPGIPGAHTRFKNDTFVLFFFSPFQRGGYKDPLSPPFTPQTFLCKQPHSKSYFEVCNKPPGGTYQTRSTPNAQQQPAHQLRTTQSNGGEGREQEGVVTMSTASTVKGSLLQPSFDKTDCLQSVCGKPAIAKT